MPRRVFCLLLIALLFPAGVAHAQQIKLRANLQFPISNPVFGRSLTLFKEEVERRSNNDITIEIFDKSQLSTDDGVVDGVASGAIDIGMTAAHQFSYKAPLVAILDQPFLFNFQALIRAAARPGSEIRKYLDDAILAGAGVRVLWWHSLGNIVIMSKGQDVADPARIKNRSVATPGKLLAEFVASCGGNPSVLTFEKFHDAFNRGEIEMAMAGFGALQSFGFWKFADTVTFTAHSPIEFLLIISERTWQSLSPTHRDAIAQAAIKVESEIGHHQTESEARANAFAKSKNVKLQELTPDQVADWRACSAGMLADYMAKNGDGGRKVMAAYGRLRTDPCCSSAPGEGDFTRR
jgi:C4-dicarboxylate-binding protein DctP